LQVNQNKRYKPFASFSSLKSSDKLTTTHSSAILTLPGCGLKSHTSF
jgi:hypothetical protein